MSEYNDGAPTVRLAHTPGSQGANVLEGRNGVMQLPASEAPALLLSYAFIKQWRGKMDDWVFRDWVLDSGAFSVHASGKAVEFGTYLSDTRELLAAPRPPVEVFALDVIGDWRASRVNAEKMWAAGVEAIPCFHYGSPWAELESLAATYPKIALGGMAHRSMKSKGDWIGQCFARVWPKRIHGFACNERLLMRFPFHSVDSSSWCLKAVAFGRWKAYGGAYLNWRGSAQNLRAEVAFYLRAEREARRRWAAEMTLLSSADGPVVRLSAGNGHEGGRNPFIPEVPQ